MVVAAGTGDRQAEESSAERVDPVIELVVDRLPVIDRPKCEEAEGGEPIVSVRPFEQVAGNLLHDELVVGLVLVQRPDDPIPIARKPTRIVPGFKRMRWSSPYRATSASDGPNRSPCAGVKASKRSTTRANASGDSSRRRPQPHQPWGADRSGRTSLVGSRFACPPVRPASIRPTRAG